MRTTNISVLVNFAGLDLLTLNPPAVVEELNALIADAAAARGWAIACDATHGVITLSRPPQPQGDHRCPMTAARSPR